MLFYSVSWYDDSSLEFWRAVFREQQIGKIMDRQLGMLELGHYQSFNQSTNQSENWINASIATRKLGLDSRFSLLQCHPSVSQGGPPLGEFPNDPSGEKHTPCTLRCAAQEPPGCLELNTTLDRRVTGIHPLELFDGAPPHEGQPGNRDVGGDPTWRRWPFTRRLPIRAHPRDQDGFNTCPLTSPNCSSC